MMFAFFLSSYIHLLAMSIWVGGMFYIALIDVPVLRRELSRYDFSHKMELLGRRFQVVGWICIAALLLSGVSNLLFRFQMEETLPASYSSYITIKILLFTVMVINTGIHTLFLGPRMAGLRNRIDSGATDLTDIYESLRKRSTISSALNLLLALIIMVFGLLAANAKI